MQSYFAASTKQGRGRVEARARAQTGLDVGHRRDYHEGNVSGGPEPVQALNDPPADTPQGLTAFGGATTAVNTTTTALVIRDTRNLVVSSPFEETRPRHDLYSVDLLFLQLMFLECTRIEAVTQARRSKLVSSLSSKALNLALRLSSHVASQDQASLRGYTVKSSSQALAGRLGRQRLWMRQQGALFCFNRKTAMSECDRVLTFNCAYQEATTTGNRKSWPGYPSGYLWEHGKLR
ncbi:hypothetical protein G7046_g258 [Stylonectria norvegica]|nr:hypothetical protein G7046_g258 [Stylonectria norvegica]